MPKFIAIVNPKGGVGKTTTATSLATISGTLKKRVLFFDFDPNASSTRSIGALDGIADSDFQENNITQLFKDTPTMPSKMAVTTKFGFDIILGSQELMDAETFLLHKDDGGQSHLFDLFLDDEGLEQYDEVIFDTGGRTGRLLSSILMVTDSVVIPAQASALSTDQLEDVIPFIEKVAKRKKRYFGEDLSISHVLLTQYREKTNAARVNQAEIAAKLEAGNITLAETKIPLSTVVEDAHIKRTPVVLYDQAGAVSKAYFDAYAEIFN